MVAPRKIIAGVIGGRVKAGCLGATKATTAALQNAAIIHPGAAAVIGGSSAGWAWARELGAVPCADGISVRLACGYTAFRTGCRVNDQDLDRLKADLSHVQRYPHSKFHWNEHRPLTVLTLRGRGGTERKEPDGMDYEIAACTRIVGRDGRCTDADSGSRRAL